MEPLTEEEKAELTTLLSDDIDRDMEEDPELYGEVRDEFDAACAAGDPWYGVPLWLLKWLLKHLPKK